MFRYGASTTSERSDDMSEQTPTAAHCETACLTAAAIISDQCAQYVGPITIADAGTVGFMLNDWDGTRYTVSIQTSAQTPEHMTRALDLISSAHAVVRDCADCNDQRYVFATDALSVAHAAMHMERAS